MIGNEGMTSPDKEHPRETKPEENGRFLVEDGTEMQKVRAKSSASAYSAAQNLSFVENNFAPVTN